MGFLVQFRESLPIESAEKNPRISAPVVDVWNGDRISRWYRSTITNFGTNFGNPFGICAVPGEILKNFHCEVTLVTPICGQACVTITYS